MMSYASLSERISEHVDEKLWNPDRPISPVRGGLATCRGISNAPSDRLAMLPSSTKRPLSEQADPLFEHARFTDGLVKSSPCDATATETRKSDMLKARNEELQCDLRKERKRAKERDQHLREAQLRIVDLERDNERLGLRYKNAQARIGELEEMLARKESENQKLRQGNDRLYFNEGMKGVRPLPHRD